MHKTEDDEFRIPPDTRPHLGCMKIPKGKMIFKKDIRLGELWFCLSCKEHVKLIPFPSYEKYQEMYKKREKNNGKKKHKWKQRKWRARTKNV